MCDLSLQTRAVLSGMCMCRNSCHFFWQHYEEKNCNLWQLERFVAREIEADNKRRFLIAFCCDMERYQDTNWYMLETAKYEDACSSMLVSTAIYDDDDDRNLTSNFFQRTVDLIAPFIALYCSLILAAYLLTRSSHNWSPGTQIAIGVLCCTTHLLYNHYSFTHWYCQYLITSLFLSRL